MLLRSASAACHSFASKPNVAPFSRARALRLLVDRGMVSLSGAVLIRRECRLGKLREWLSRASSP